MSIGDGQNLQPDGLEEFSDEMILLGLAMLGAQKFEFALYGMASHLKAHDRRFKDLTAEEFLRGDGTKTKQTLGAIAQTYGAQFQFDGDELMRFVIDRNLIAHDYWRLTRAKINGGRTLPNPKEFLLNFIKRCDTWTRLCQGWITLAKTAAAELSGRLDEINETPESIQKMLEYLIHVLERPAAEKPAEES
ncbi:hypothetical protein [Pseudomonas fluorescens]|nr:hypothetical protein [Pseudomonas fluorescens]